jgi:ribose/xylose/arabinose/galactoside ABC-type transport system permease subunit
MAGQLRIGAAATLVIAVLGVPAGLLWTTVAPRTTYVIAGGKALLGDPESQTLIAADGWFAVLTALAGVLCGAVAYVLAGRLRDMGLIAALGAGGAAAGLIAWWVGSLVGRSSFQHQVRTARDGTTARSALDLHAAGVVIAWPLIAIVVFGLLEALDVARRESRPAAGYAGGVGPGQPDQVGGGQFDLQPAPPRGDVDRGEP